MKKGLIIFLVFSFLFTIASSQMDGAPWPPQPASPANGATAGINPPKLCAIDSGDPENETVWIKFEAWGGGENDHQSDWIQSPGKGQTVCWQDSTPWSAQTHSWQARAKDSNNNQSGASPDWSVNVPAIASGGGKSGGNSGSGGSTPSASCKLLDFTRTPPSPQQAGTSIYIHVSASCTNGVSKITVSVAGTNIGTINGGDGSLTWNTSGLSAGPYTIRVVVGDQSAGFIFNTAENYDLTAGAPPPTQQVSCNITSFSVDPQPPATLGTQVTINTAESCNTGARAERIYIDGNLIKEFGASPSFAYTWDTTNASIGNHQIKVVVAGQYDNNWSQAAQQTYSYSIGTTIEPSPTSNLSSQQQNQSSSIPPVNSSCSWSVGERVGLKGGAAIRYGSGMSYQIEIQVPSDNWQVDIIDGPRSADGVTWWDVSRQKLDGGGTGWVFFEQAGMSGCIGSANPPSNPNPPIENTNNPISGGGLPGDGHENNPSWIENALNNVQNFLVGPVDAASGSNCASKFVAGNCTAFVASVRQDVCAWVGDNRNAYQWASQAQKNGSFYGVSVDQTPQVGDIAVWPANCGGTPASPPSGPCTIGASGDYEGCGHVAYVTLVAGTTINVEEYNWSNKFQSDSRTVDLSRLVETNSPLVTCQLSFITKPIYPYPGEPSNQNNSSQGNQSPPSSSGSQSTQNSQQPAYCSWFKNILGLNNLCNSGK